jgi:hypothetical protein
LDNQQPSPQGKVQRLGVKTHECMGKVIKGSPCLKFSLLYNMTGNPRMESKYFESILEIRDKIKSEIIPLEQCSIQKISSLYSNTKVPIYKLVINTKPISRNNTYLVKYKCLTCSIIQEITLNLFIRKIHKQIVRCDACKNKDSEKCQNQSKFMKDNYVKIKDMVYETNHKPVKSVSITEQLQNSESDWNNETAEFKDNYFKKHLTAEEFNNIKRHIISFGNDKLCNLIEWTYFPFYRIYNQTRYTPMLINLKESSIEKPNYCKFLCENCECTFIHRDLFILKDRHKIFCQTCLLTNKTFKIRSLKLKDGTKILWQSVPERRFISWCVENNIKIQNGPSIEYIFQDKTHVYRVDFQLPELRMLIEIKDNHCWHKAQVLSGKFLKKETAAIKWGQENSYTFHVVYPKNVQSIKESILKLCKI